MAWTNGERRNKLPLRRHIWEQEDSHQYHAGRQPTMYLQMHLPVAWTEKLVSTEKIGRRRDLDPEQLPWLLKNSGSVLQITKNPETLFRRASEHAEFARTVEIGQSYITNESVMDGNSCTLLCREYSERQGILEIQDCKQFSTITRASNRNRSVRVCRNFGYRSASTVTTARKFEVLGAYITRNWTVLTTVILTKPEHPNSGAVFSPLSSSCGRPRAVNFHQYKAVPRPKPTSIGFSHRDWKVLPARAKHKRIVNSKAFSALHEYLTTRRLSWSWRSSTMDTCFDTHGRDWANSNLGTKKIWLTHSVVVTTNPKWSFTRTNTKRLFTFVQYKAPVMGLQSIQTCSFFSDTVELEGTTHIQHGQLFQLQINLTEWSMGR